MVGTIAVLPLLTVKVTPADKFDVIEDSTHGVELAPEHAPLHVPAVYPEDGVAVRVTLAPEA
jgi:hypothetical protein